MTTKTKRRRKSKMVHLHITSELHRAIRIEAASAGVTMQAWVEQILEQWTTDHPSRITTTKERI